jgi:hypothetical protein
MFNSKEHKTDLAPSARWADGKEKIIKIKSNMNNKRTVFT